MEAKMGDRVICLSTLSELVNVQVSMSDDMRSALEFEAQCYETDLSAIVRVAVKQYFDLNFGHVA